MAATVVFGGFSFSFFFSAELELLIPGSGGAASARGKTARFESSSFQLTFVRYRMHCGFGERGLRRLCIHMYVRCELARRNADMPLSAAGNSFQNRSSFARRWLHGFRRKRR